MYTLAIALLTVSAGYAQKGRGEKISPEKRAEKYTAMLQEKLSLSDAQKAKVLAIQLESQKKAVEFRADTVGLKRERAEAHKEFLKAQQVKMNKVLTEDQKVKFKAFREEEKAKSKDKVRSHKKGSKR